MWRNEMVADLMRLGWREHRAGADVAGELNGGLLEGRFRAAIAKLNADADGRSWLNDTDLDTVWDTMSRRLPVRLAEGNQALAELLRSGVDSDEIETPTGRPVRLVDWTGPDTNDLLVVTDLPVPRRQDGGAPTANVDLALFVNGILFAAVMARPAEEGGVPAAVMAVRRAIGTQGVSPPREVPEFFKYATVVAVTDGDRAELGTVTSREEDFSAWKTTVPWTDARVAIKLDARGPLSPLGTLTVGALAPDRLLDIARNFTLFRPDGTRIVARYQQYRAVLAIVLRLLEGSTPRDRGGLLWHTQGSGKSLTMAFLIRKMSTTPELRGHLVVIVSDRIELKDQLHPVLRLSGREPRIAATSADARRLLAEVRAGVVQLMIQQARRDDAGTDTAVPAFAGDGSAAELGVLNGSERILVLIDEAHRTQSGELHARLSRSLPNATKIGFTGTPIIPVREGDHGTRKTFGEDIDEPYTLKQAQEDGATVPIRYEGRHIGGEIHDPEALDEAAARSDEAVGVGRREVLESAGLIADKARDMLLHWATGIMQRGFKAQLVAVSRRAAVEYRSALLRARDELVAAVEEYQLYLQAPYGYDAGDLELVRRRLDLLRNVDFVSVISGSNDPERPDPPEWRRWTDRSAQRTAITRFLADFPAPALRTSTGPEEDPWSAVEAEPVETSVAFLIVQGMLLTGFDAPIEQVLYIDRPIRRAELLQAIARTNRPRRGKPYGLVVDYVALAENMEEALSVYDDKDLSHLIVNFFDEEVGGLDRAAEQMEQTILELGGLPSDTEGWDGLVAALSDPETRQRFRARAREFFGRVERLLPRAEALRHEELMVTVELIRLRLRNAAIVAGAPLESEEPVGALLRELLDRHVRGREPAVLVPPVEITDDRFRAAVDALRGDEERAALLREALEREIERTIESEPELSRRLSTRLRLLLLEFDGAWDRLAAGLADLIDQVLTDQAEIHEHQLDPATEGHVYRELLPALNEVFPEIAPDHVAQLARHLTEVIRRCVAPPHFAESPHLQGKLIHTLAREIELHTEILNRSEVRPVAVTLTLWAAGHRALFEAP